MIKPAYYVGIEFVAGSYTTITDDVLKASYNRTLGGAFSGFTPGGASFIIDNPSGKYSPSNAASPFAGLMRPNLPIKLAVEYPDITQTTIVDKSTNQNTGSILGDSHQWVEGLIPVGSALKFDGTSGMILTEQSNPITSAADPFTIESWITLHEMKAADTGLFCANRSLVGAWGLFRNVEDNNISFSVRDNGALRNVNIDVSSKLNQAAHYAGVNHGNGGISFFVNGVLTGTDSAAVVGSISNLRLLMNGLINKSGAAATDHQNMTIDECRLWTIARSQDDIIGSMNKPLRGDESGLWGYWPMDGLNRSLFTGFIDDWKPDPSLSAIRNTYITARDAGKVLRHKTITTSLFTNYNAGSLFTEILTGAGVSSLSVDTMDDVIPFAFYRDRNAQNAIDELIQAGYSFAYIDGAGTFNVKKRYYEIEGSIVGSLSEFMALNYTLSDRAVYNYVTVEGEPRRAATSTQTLASLPTPFYIPASSAISFFLEYLDPANSEPVPGIEMVTPVSSTDYLTNAASNGGGANLTATTSVSAVFFAQTAYNTVFNGSATDAYLTKYTLRGKPVQRLSRFTALSEHASSQNFYGTLVYALSNPLIGDQRFGQNYADFILARNADPFPELGCVIQNEFPLLLSAEVSDQLHIVNTFSGINSAHVIQAMNHTIDLTRGLQHTAEYTIERYNDQGVFVLDHPVYGELDDRKLGF
jgi:hypothetical protein